jgi:hypothetical protein
VHGGLGIFDGVVLANADEIVLPLTPHHIAVLGRGSQSGQATADEVDRFNTLKARLARWHVHFKPAAGLAGLVRWLLGAQAA